MIADTVILKFLGRKAYLPVWQAMQKFTNEREDSTPDEIWLLEHDPVFTQGQNGKPEHILNAGDIPIIPVDRGGQITYHGPGQLVAYPLIDLRRKKLNIRQMVTVLEQSVIDLLQSLDITAAAQCKAPGVYVGAKKICSVGLRVRKGCTFHGLALNVAMNLEPFLRINPCGFANLEMTQISAYYPQVNLSIIMKKLADYLSIHLGYNQHIIAAEWEHAI